MSAIESLNNNTFFLIDCYIGNDPALVIAIPSYNKTIKSLNYPLDYYGNTECKWRVKIEDKLDFLFGGYVMKVIFNDFDLQTGQGSSFPGCLYDNLEFYDGYSESSPLLGSYCGTVHPEAIYSTGSYLFIKFHIGSANAFGRFSISVSVVGAGTDS